jgi:hypothetical protein
VVSNDFATEHKEFGKDVIGSGCDLFQVLIRHFPEGTYEIKEITQSLEQWVSRPQFEQESSRIEVTRVKVSGNLLGHRRSQH